MFSETRLPYPPYLCCIILALSVPSRNIQGVNCTCDVSYRCRPEYFDVSSDHGRGRDYRGHSDVRQNISPFRSCPSVLILRDIRQGLLQLGRGRSADDTYMYDDEMQRLGQHWYDEPPYESDPEDFLMAETANNSRSENFFDIREATDAASAGFTLNARTDGHNTGETARWRHLAPSPPEGAAATASAGFTLNARTDGHNTGETAVISLRSAGDISLPHHQRGLLLPQSGPFPPTLIPLTHARNNRESGDYAASDVQSVCSRLSSLSMETSRSETTDHYQRLRNYNGGESAVSPGHSSDYAEQDELVTVHSSFGNSSVAHRVRGLKGEGVTGKVISSRHHHHHYHQHQRSPDHLHHHQPRSPEHHQPHHSSAESLPSGSSTQALVPPSSNHSSEEGVSPSDKQPNVIARARALVDYTPSPYDKDILKFKKGDIIEVLSMNASGLWRGRAHGRVGNFKFINVELLNESSLRPRPCRHRPQTLEQMLRTIHMEDHMSLFVLNGYEDLDAFCDIEEKDLDYLGIHDLQQRAKILAAVQVLNEYESPDECTSSADEGQNSQSGLVDGELPGNNLGSSDTSPPAISCKEAAQIMQQTYLPNIPLNRPGHTLEMNVFSDKTASDTVVEKVGVVKYIGADLACESGNPQNRNCSTLSEKSSDSGMTFQLNDKAPIPVGKS
ncbi:regulation of protein autoubiquitination, variant 2 [Homalodisca vitripennis]|nr:regulation of protein autoubiquitination, variant 2 [Homalodisca vitripennis]